MGQDYDHAAVILRMIHLRQSRQLVFDLLKSGVCLLAWYGAFKGLYVFTEGERENSSHSLLQVCLNLHNKV